MRSCCPAQGTLPSFFQQNLMEENEKAAVGIITMEYYSTIQKNETIPFAATWMNLVIPNGSQVRHKEKTNTSAYTLLFYICKNHHKTVTMAPDHLTLLQVYRTKLPLCFSCLLRHNFPNSIFSRLLTKHFSVSLVNDICTGQSNLVSGEDICSYESVCWKMFNF